MIPPATERSFLFLQGPHGSFFPRLGAALREAGSAVHRINLNGGDRATWPGGTDFAGFARGWPGFVARFLARHAVTDLVLFGDCRPAHVHAIAAAHACGVRIHVFEEGYIRPDWVTLEQGGVNGNSSLSRDPEWYRAAAAGLPPVPEFPPIPSYRAVRGWGAFFYYAECVLQFARFPFHRSHRPTDPVGEGIQWLVRFGRRKAEHARTRAALARLDGARYVAFPLQLDSDYQLRRHSPFPDMTAAIRTVLESFAAHAPPALRLAVKEHPLDAGRVDWRRVTLREAERIGIADRVDFLEHGDTLALVRGAVGLVTINSTVGPLALGEGVAVVVLGTAVYDIAGLTHRAGLDAFWQAPEPPDAALFDAFRRVLVDRCLLHGAFLSDVGSNVLVAGAARAMLRTGGA